MKTEQKNTTESKLTNLPRIVSREEWQRERDQLLVKEKRSRERMTLWPRNAAGCRW